MERQRPNTDESPQQGSRAIVEARIRDAFAGVRLGAGVSLRQAAAIDRWLDGLSAAEFEALPASEVTDDWSAVPDNEIDSDNLAHLDAEGLRYYLPACMLRLLDEYVDGSEMWVIGTIAALDQRAGHPVGFHELLSTKQRVAIACYVRALPGLVELDPEDSTRMARAFRDVWSKYLPRAGAPDGSEARSGPASA